MIKFNANQRYATTAITASIVRQIAKRSNVPLQVITEIRMLSQLHYQDK